MSFPPLATSEPRYVARPYATGDEQSICQLFTRSFGRPFSLEEWAWKYRDSPVARPTLSWVGTTAQGEVVGHIGMRPMRLNFLGRPLMGCQSLDGMVDEPHRMGGLARLTFTGAVDSAFKARELVCLLNMPNEQSLFGLQQTMTLMFMMERYALPLGGRAHEALRQRVEAQAPDARGPCTLLPRYVLDERQDALWKGCATREHLSVWKDREYLDWKYLRRPHIQYRMMALEQAGTLAALAVLHEDGPRAHVLELMSQGKSVPCAQELLLRVADHYRTEGLRELRFVGRDPWYFASVFQDCERQPIFGHHVYTGTFGPEQRFIYETAANWTVTLGDNENS
jgi:hypothetical protein